MRGNSSNLPYVATSSDKRMELKYIQAPGSTYTQMHRKFLDTNPPR